MTLNDVLIQVSYVEIYNEQIRDLLIPKDTSNVFLDLREDPIKGVSLSGATEIKVEAVEEVMNLLFQGNKRRITEATNANQTSSRSHAVFQIAVSISPKTKDINIERVCAKLSLIDLAGSERGTVTENRGMRLREGAKINQSLLALANCINALGDKTKKGSFVPYRDSKLTRMLKDSLGGNCKTVMLVTTSPSSSQFEETVNTLKYANRAKNITTKPIENKKLVEFHIAEYKSIITELRNEIEELRHKMKSPNSAEEPEACDFCRCQKQSDKEEVRKIKEELFENFQERIQIKRGLCELEAQNQLNEMEIRQDQEMLMRYTLSRSGKLIAKENCENLEEYMNLPSNLKKQLNDIKTLKVSLDLNGAKKQLMQKELQLKAEQARKIMASIPQRVPNQEKKEFLEVIVKNYIVQLENDELEYNLKLQEKLNLILMEEIKRLRGLCENNGIILSEKEDNEDDFEMERGKGSGDRYEHKNMSSVSPQRKFKKKLFSNQSLYEKTKNLEKIDAEDKVSSEKKTFGSNTELTLPPIKEFNSPKTKKSQMRAQSKKSKDKKMEFVKMEQEIKNVVNIVSSLQTITPEALNEKRVKLEMMKNLKVGKVAKQNLKNLPSKELKQKMLN
jgi:kinesin family protein 18/19